jgi:predicted nucleotidyltransferase
MEVLYQKGSLKPDQFRQSLSPHMPKESYQLLEQAFIKKLLLFPSDVDIPLHTKLFEKEELTAFADCTEDLQNRILKNRDQYIGYEAFANLLKNKSLTRSRITRVLTHILLGITDEDLTLLKRRDYAPYFWILAASAKGKGYMGVLKQKDLPLFCSINEISSSLNMEKSDTRRLLALDLKASEVVRILRIHKCRRPLPTEYTRKVVL